MPSIMAALTVRLGAEQQRIGFEIHQNVARTVIPNVAGMPAVRVIASVERNACTRQ